MKIRYNYALLCELAKKHNAALTGNYDVKGLNCKTRIAGKCCCESCDGVFEKTFEILVKFEKFECKDCVDKGAQELKEPNKEAINAKRAETLMQTTGFAYVLQNPKSKEKGQQTLLKNYKVKHTMQSEELREKAKQTLLKNHEVDSPLKSKKLLEKKQETTIKNFGEEGLKHPKIAEKKKQTSQKNWGTDHPAQSPLVQERMEKGMLKNHGTRHSMHVPASLKKMLKSSFSKKDYVFPSGRVVSIMGDEGYALNHLINIENVGEHDIFAGEDGNIPIIPYKDANGKEHIYYPDIFIPKQNRIIEVKSDWTLNLALETNMLKFNATKALGYDFEIWVYNNRKERVKVI